MRRHFDSAVTRLANGAANPGKSLCTLQGTADFCEAMQAVDPRVAAG
jgi:hypothetical protein